MLAKYVVVFFALAAFVNAAPIVDYRPVELRSPGPAKNLPVVPAQNPPSKNPPGKNLPVVPAQNPPSNPSPDKNLPVVPAQNSPSKPSPC